MRSCITIIKTRKPCSTGVRSSTGWLWRTRSFGTGLRLWTARSRAFRVLLFDPSYIPEDAQDIALAPEVVEQMGGQAQG